MKNKTSEIINRKKKRMNKHVSEFLDYYVNQPDPRYSVMLTGEWGCGKTHFIKRWIEELVEKTQYDKASTLTKPIYISLFGLSSIHQLNDAITREIYPLMKSRIYQLGKHALNAVSNVTLNYDLSKLSKGLGEASIELDLVSLFRSESRKNNENRIVVFDDFERCGVDLADMLGYINQFVEHSNVRVIIICNEDEICSEDKPNYYKFKEKLAGRSFQIKPDTLSTIKDFCEIPGITTLSKEQQLITKDVFNKVGHKNLRSLYQGLQDFSGIIEKLHYDDTDIRQREFINRLLIQYVVAYCEFPANETIRKMSTQEPSGIDTSMLHFLLDNQDDNETALKQKYDGLAGYTPSSWVFDNPMSYILHSIVDGGDISKIIDALINPKEEQVVETIFQKLSRFLTMENEEFETTYSEALEYITNPESDLVVMLQTISTLLAIDSRGIRKIEDAFIHNSLNNCEEIVSKFRDLNEIIRWKKSQFDGIMMEIKHFSENQRLRDIVEKIDKLLCDKISELEEKEIQELEMLNNENFDDVVAVYFYQFGSDIVPRYEGKPFFSHIDPNIFAVNLSQISNENKLNFRNLLLDRYGSQQNAGLFDRYGSEIPILKEISNKLQLISETKKDIDKWEIEELSRTFEKVANQIEADK